MRKLIMLCVAVLALSGCSARLITKRGISSQYAPSNEKHGGTVRYSGGSSSARERAYKLMKNYCHGPYRTVSEFNGNEEGGITNPTSYEYTDINFECEDTQH